MALPKAPKKSATEKRRVKMRGNRRSIEDIHMGPEPTYFGVEIPEEEYWTRWTKAANWYNYFLGPKDWKDDILKYTVEVLGYTEQEAKTLTKLADWKLNLGVSTICKLHYRGMQQPEKYYEKVKTNIAEKMVEASKIIDEAKAKVKAKPVITIQDRMRAKMHQTVMVDWDMLIDEWMDGKYNAKFHAYEVFKTHNLKGATMTMFAEVVQFEHDVMSDAYNKTCDQAVEAYSHVKRADLKKMITTMDTIFSDLERLKQSAKSARLPRKKKVKASDQQIKKLNYLVEDIDSKLVSINPVMIPTNKRLFVYNTKTRKLAMYVSDTEKGFEVRGSTIHNWNEEFSKITTLRKPDEILPQILSKTERQIENLWDTFTTKISVPNGRINKDCILVRVSDK